MTQKWSGNELVFNNGGSLVKMEVEGQYIVSARINKLASCQFSVLFVNYLWFEEFVKVINNGYFYSNPVDLDSRG